MLKCIDEELALKLHLSKSPAPYSVTPLETVGTPRPFLVYNELDRSSQLRFRITVLEPGLAYIFARTVWMGPPSVRLVQSEAQLIDLSITPKTFRRFLEEARPVEKFAVNFNTPCYSRKSIGTDVEESLPQDYSRPPYRSVPYQK